MSCGIIGHPFLVDLGEGVQQGIVVIPAFDVIASVSPISALLNSHRQGQVDQIVLGVFGVLDCFSLCHLGVLLRSGV